jgi:predicted Fe-S protein YdhL (DUF1289 family)
MMSPCVRVCRLGPDDKCEGCGRSVGEIRGWAGMTRDERWEIMKRLAAEGFVPASAIETP